MQSQNKNEMFTVINEYHTFSGKQVLKQHLTKRSSSWRKLNFLATLSPQMEFNLLQNE